MFMLPPVGVDLRDAWAGAVFQRHPVLAVSEIERGDYIAHSTVLLSSSIASCIVGGATRAYAAGKNNQVRFAFGQRE
jgi:hypothetical protein